MRLEVLDLKCVHILNSHYRRCGVDKQTMPSSRYSSLFPGLDDKKSVIEIIAGDASALINVHSCLFYLKRIVERQLSFCLWFRFFYFKVHSRGHCPDSRADHPILNCAHFARLPTIPSAEVYRAIQEHLLCDCFSIVICAEPPEEHWTIVNVALLILRLFQRSKASGGDHLVLELPKSRIWYNIVSSRAAPYGGTPETSCVVSSVVWRGV